MDKEKIKELIVYLAGIAFKSERLEVEIRKNIGLGLTYFSVGHQMNYGDEQMFYDLRFRKDHQFGAYRLEGYKATHRKPVEISHQIINGIDTRELETRMKEIDWYDHFTRSEKYPENPKDEGIAKMISDLLELDANRSQEGIKIQELLQFKYFPEQYYDERLKELQSQYDLSSEFIATESGLCNANLAYHSVSGRLDNLYEMLQSLELNQYPGMDVYAKLETILSSDPDAFELKCFRNEPEGYAEYVVPVIKVNGDYFTDNYTLSLTPYPPIDHGVFNGIDTGELEIKMQEIDWHNDLELFIPQEDQEPELKPRVEEIVSQINRLSEDPKDVEAADLLKLKYWTDASFLDNLLEERTWNCLESLPKRIQQFPVEMSAKSAFNLLCGRAILNTPLLRQGKETATWMKLDLSHKDENGNYLVKTMEEFSLSDLEKCLDLLPIDNINFYPIRNALKRGDLLPVQLNDNRKVMLQANPEQKTIDVFTADMQPIYVNLRLDPDWKPSIIQKENAPEISQKAPPKPKQNSFSKQSKKRYRRGRRM
jgi:hypothetical protein